MPHAAICNDCGRLAAALEDGRCPSCRPAFRTRTERRREAQEPWRALYRMREWAVARALRIERDGGRCSVGGCRETIQTVELEVHHDPPLAVLWRIARDWRDFVRRACDPDKLRSVCPAHNRELDEAWRARRARSPLDQGETK